MDGMQGTLARFEQAVPDADVERVWVKIRRELKVPDDLDMQFATYIQPSTWGVKDGIEQPIPEIVGFIVTSPHKRFGGKLLKTPAYTSLKDFREALDDHWRLAGAPDPVYQIFKALTIQHMAAVKSYNELN